MLTKSSIHTNNGSHSHMRRLSIGNVTSVTEELHFKFYFIVLISIK